MFSPYRCRNCNAHFRVISEKFKRFLLVIVGVATIVILTLIVANSCVTVHESSTLPKSED